MSHLRIYEVATIITHQQSNLLLCPLEYRTRLVGILMTETVNLLVCDSSLGFSTSCVYLHLNKYIAPQKSR
jgi:hypothetical protein